MSTITDKALSLGFDVEVTPNGTIRIEAKGPQAAARILRMFASEGHDYKRCCAAGQTDPALNWRGEPTTARSWSVLRDGEHWFNVLCNEDTYCYAYAMLR